MSAGRVREQLSSQRVVCATTGNRTQAAIIHPDSGAYGMLCEKSMPPGMEIKLVPERPCNPSVTLNHIKH